MGDVIRLSHHTNGVEKAKQITRDRILASMRAFSESPEKHVVPVLSGQVDPDNPRRIIPRE